MIFVLILKVGLAEIKIKAAKMGPILVKGEEVAVAFEWCRRK